MSFCKQDELQRNKNDWKQNKRTGEYWQGESLTQFDTVQEYTSLADEVNNRLLRVRTVAGRKNEANETIKPLAWTSQIPSKQCRK